MQLITRKSGECLSVIKQMDDESYMKVGEQGGNTTWELCTHSMLERNYIVLVSLMGIHHCRICVAMGSSITLTERIKMFANAWIWKQC